jgi:hypothetical protein
MKHFIFILALISAALFTGCSDAIITVTNNTSKDITYKLHIYPNYEDHVIRAYTTNTHGAKNGLSHGIESYTPSSLPESVYLETYGDTYTFNEIITPISVYNTLKKDIELSASGYLNSNPIIINSETEWSGLLYTPTPQFSVKTVDGYPVSISHVFSDGKCLVTVHGPIL